MTASSLLRLLGWLALPLAVGGLSGYFTSSSVAGWYRTLEAPPFAPPDWVFGPVWTALYIMMGWAAFLVASETGCTARHRRRALGLFFLQLALNFLWSLLFFGLERPDLALIDILALWIAIGLTWRQFARVARLAGWLLVPYWAWVSFAAVLNAGFWWLNH